MKLLASVVLAAAVASSTFAQNIAIGAPTAGSSVLAGKKLVVEVDRPDSLTGSQEVAIVIAMNSCSSNGCTAPEDVLGHVLYNGPYNPQFQSGEEQKPPHQNFTVTVPSSLEMGPAILSVTHLTLVGAGPEPILEFKNVSLNIK